MRYLGRMGKILFQKISGFNVERVGGNSFLLIDQRRREDAWLSYDGQVKAIIEKESIDLVLDVGANEGQFSQKIRSFYSGKILSFEPIPSVFEKLEKTASSDPNWYVYNCALGSQECIQKIHVSKHTVFSSLLRSNEYCSNLFGKDSLGERCEVVSVRRADKLLEEIAPVRQGNRIFLKMDTQGYDAVVFEGLGDVLKSVVLLQSEVSLIPIYDGMPHWTENISIYEKKGFSVTGMFPVNRDAGKVIEYDCLMIRSYTQS